MEQVDRQFRNFCFFSNIFAMKASNTLMKMIQITNVPEQFFTTVQGNLDKRYLREIYASLTVNTYSILVYLKKTKWSIIYK